MYGDLGIMRSAVTLARANYEVTILKDAVLWDKIGNDSNVDETVAVHQAFTGEIFPQLSLQYPWIRAERATTNEPTVNRRKSGPIRSSLHSQAKND
jgi:hypothetical protein